MWSQAKAQRLSTEISTFVDSVSRPWSAFNRLGSFIKWTQNYHQDEDAYIQHANEGYIWDEDSKSLKKVDGKVNVSLNKTLNYLSKVHVKKDLSDVIVSSNSD